VVASRARGLFCAFSPAREGNLCLSASAACSESRLWPKRGRGGTATRVSDGRMRLGGFSGSGAHVGWLPATRYGCEIGGDGRDDRLGVIDAEEAHHHPEGEDDVSETLHERHPCRREVDPALKGGLACGRGAP